MRVIAGSAKGRPIESVPGGRTRPITDRVKSALFSILGSLDLVTDCRYLDLFGGTGAVGIEALSRGAAGAVFCELDGDAVRILQRNLERTGLASKAEVVRGDAFKYLERAGPPAFDVIYVAPPQYKGLWLQSLRALDTRPELLAPRGRAITQIFPKEWSELELAHLELLDRRQYGSTALFFFGRRPL